MEISEQPRRLGGRLVAIVAILALAVVWATVALASGSGSGSTSSPSSGSTGVQVPAATTYSGGPHAQFAANGPDGECPDDEGGTTVPSTPTPSTPATPSTADGSTDPTL